jgi:hypothetical protein
MFNLVNVIFHLKLSLCFPRKNNFDPPVVDTNLLKTRHGNRMEKKIKNVMFKTGSVKEKRVLQYS